MAQRKPFVMIILDGFGVAPPSDSNGITLARKPHFDSYITHFPTYTLMAAGESVGLSWGEIGNSEVGHGNLGVGRILFQFLPRIDKAITDQTFFENTALQSAMTHAKEQQSQLHILGLMSEGKVHSSLSHAYALLQMAKKQKVKKVFLHCFLDGRDSLYNSGKDFIAQLQKAIDDIGVGKIATISGRFYAMDRDNHWERVGKAYQAMVDGRADEYFDDPLDGIQASYDRRVFDEELVPFVVGREGRQVGMIQDNDAIIFMNYRSDRARQLTRSLVTAEPLYQRTQRANLKMVTMTDYATDLPVSVAFSRDAIKTTLSGVISDAGLNQFHIAETEKYAHVTFFFNGGLEDVFKNEDRLVIPSPRVASYADKPEMSAVSVTKQLIKTILQEKHDMYVVNFANPDMVGHTGNIPAVVQAVETIDYCIGEIVDVVMSKGGSCIITSDHGNCEELRNLQTGEISKDHSTNPVPCIIIGEELRGKTNPESQLIGKDLSLLRPVGLLSDITATTLKLLGLEIPKDMTGQPLI
jgi:2,3-bisphosphoglycerate-independent phosphoglycerate mutase